MTRRRYRSGIPTFVISFSICFLLVFLLVTACLPAAPADTPFLRKYNSFAVDMNKLRDGLQTDVADRRQFQKAYRSFEMLYADDGWLK